MLTRLERAERKLVFGLDRAAVQRRAHIARAVCWDHLIAAFLDDQTGLVFEPESSDNDDTPGILAHEASCEACGKHLHPGQGMAVCRSAMEDHRARLLEQRKLINQAIQAKQVEQAKRRWIIVTVAVWAAGNCAVEFKIRRNTPLRKLFDRYCSEVKFRRGHVKFIYCDKEIMDDKNCFELDIEDEGVIRCVHCDDDRVSSPKRFRAAAE